MRASLLTLSLVGRVGAVLTLMALFLTPLRAHESTIPIQCSPSSVVLHANRSGDWLTVHADIAYGYVVTDSVVLKAPIGDLKATATFPDDRGDLVAKFRMSDLIKLLKTTEPTNDLRLTGVTDDGDPFAGTDTVRIVNK